MSAHPLSFVPGAPRGSAASHTSRRRSYGLLGSDRADARWPVLWPIADDLAMRSSRWGRHPELGTSSAPDTSPDACSRTRMLRWHRVGLPRETRLRLFFRISRSSFNCLTSRRSRRTSSRSAVVSPSALRPSSRSSCFTQLWIVCAVGSNSRLKLFRRPPRSYHFNYLTPELRRVRWSRSWHCGLLSLSRDRVST